MEHVQKPDFVFRRNGRVHLNRRGASVQSTTGSRGVRISGSNTGYTMFRGSVKSTGYSLHSPVSPSPPVRHRVTSYFNSTLRHRTHYSVQTSALKFTMIFDILCAFFCPSGILSQFTSLLIPCPATNIAICSLITCFPRHLEFPEP